MTDIWKIDGHLVNLHKSIRDKHSISVAMGNDYDFEFEDMPVRYPVGEHSFRELRRGGYLYVDKTYYLARLIKQGKFIFLSRPRRFGKSLMLSTIECFFRGEKELFEGTWIAPRVKEWKSYSVLHFDMSRTNGFNADTMLKHLNRRLEALEAQYEMPINSDSNDLGDRFSSLIEGIYKKTGKQVVILIDEYDNGILETLNDSEEEQEAMSDVLRSFYRQPKAMTECVRFCMVTGVARFGSYTLFSGGNNYLDISMMPNYASICGITQKELLDNFQEGIKQLSSAHSMGHEEMIEALRLKYDSYRFTQSEELVYNPYSLLCAFTELRLDNFWIKTGISKVFVKYLSRSEFDLLELENLWVTRERMEAKYQKGDSIPLLFQTGYFTIKDILDFKSFRLGIPNGEVRSALVDQLMPIYMGISENQFSTLLTRLHVDLKKGETNEWIKDIQSLISKIPHQLFGPLDSRSEDKEVRQKIVDSNISHFERTYHIIIHMICQMIKVDIESEVSFSGGRADMVIKTNRFIYVIEFKLDSTTAEALKQIDDKGYLLPWHADGRKVYKVGIVFSSKLRNLSAYQFVEG